MRAERFLAEALAATLPGRAGAPDFRVRERDPRQDLEYGGTLSLCADPKPYRALRAPLAAARRRAPRDASAWLLSGVVEAMVGRFRAAERLLSRALALDPRLGAALAWRGAARSLESRRRRSQEGLREALSDLDRALELGADPSFVLPWTAELRHDLDLRREALRDVERLLAREPGLAWARVERGEILCELGRPKDALAQFDALVRETGSGWALALRGRTLATSGRERESLADLTRAVRLEPRAAAPRAWLSEALRKLGRYRRARRELDVAVRLDPGFVLAWIWRGRLKLLAGDPRGALRDLDRAARLDPRYTLAFAWRGEALLKLGRRRAALADLARSGLSWEGTWNPVLKEGERLTPEKRLAAYREDLREASAARRPKVAVMARMAEGRRLVDRGDLRGAIRKFDAALALDDQAAQAYLYRAGLKLLVGDEDGALADFRAISTLDHSRLPAYRDLTTLSAEEFPALIDACSRLLARAPECAWLHVFHAFSLRSLMRYEEAIADLDRAVACEPRSAALWAMRSRVKLTNRQGLYDGARDMERAVALAPDWGWLNCWLGEALRHQGEQTRALAALDKGLALDPRYKRGQAWRGGVLVALGRHREALRDLERALAYDPIYHHDFEYTADQKSWAYNQRMLARRGLGDVAGALAELDRAHGFGPRYAWVFNPSGKPEVWAKGVAELDAVLRESPRLYRAWAWRGWTELQRGDAERAVSDLRRAIALAPRAPWPRAWLGRALLNLGRPAEALAALDAALARDRDYAPAWGWRGEALRLLGRARRAEADFTRAIALDHRAAWAFAARGECRARRGALAASLADLDRSLAILPGYPEALGWRAETKRLLGDRRGALADADAALAAKPGLVLVYVTRALVKRSLKDFRGGLEDFRRAERLKPGLLAEAAA